jgi:uncharacterized protein YkwD
MIRAFAFSALLLLTFAGLSPAVHSEKPQISPSELSQMIHELVNLERTKVNLRPLTWNETLFEVARLHSEDMAKLGYFAHVNFNKKDPAARALALGFKCEKDFGVYKKVGIAENIFQNNTIRSVTYVGDRIYCEYLSMEEIARSTVKGWMESEGHRNNILDKQNYSEGIGVAIANDDKIYITEDFC